MAKQLGFLINAGRCVQCQACEVACKATNSIELGPKWRRVETHWEGRFPDVTNIAASKACMHCAKPSCIDACPVQAISKRAGDGIVVLRRNLVVSGTDLNTLIGVEFELQTVVLRGVEECRPCYWMDRALGPGAERWLRGRGGLRCQVLTSGWLRAERQLIPAAGFETVQVAG
jgi:ferredoxin